MAGAPGDDNLAMRTLSLLWKRFSPLEERLLAQVRGVLPPDAQPIFDAQVAAINHVQRLPPSWSEIDFYHLRGGRPDWSRVPAFPCTDEFDHAAVRFRVGGKPYQATLAGIRGHIFDFSITPGPKSIAFSSWDDEPSASLIGDPLRTSTGERRPDPLPEEWRQFLTRRSGVPPPGWVLHDESSAYRVALESGVYVVLAEREGDEFILHRVEPPAERLFHLEGHDGLPKLLDRALEALI